ncbi:hypothetical protein B296_00020520 [Ensete ventricosum]|uniref:SOSEKI DIX-like domain-containing protein n=1 Tax=Ensete ventricosum TaxID=4639 RepID=A0A426YJQ1_ENSVE|nr:hypothetical protein B296_00020520 [Ensete ventricosum]
MGKPVHRPNHATCRQATQCHTERTVYTPGPASPGTLFGIKREEHRMGYWYVTGFLQTFPSHRSVTRLLHLVLALFLPTVNISLYLYPVRRGNSRNRALLAVALCCCCSCCVGKMEVRSGKGRRLSGRETSPDRARLGCSQQQQQRSLRPLRKVQIIYYLSRNGQLEHPHFIELPYLPNQQLRLRERFQHVAARSRRLKALPAPHKLHLELEEDEEDEAELGVAEEGAEEVRGGKRNVDGARHSRRSGGVSTEEIERNDNPTTARSHHHHHVPTELPLDDSSPPSSTSSDKPPTHAPGCGTSQRFEDADPAPEPGLTRNSVLLQLIACGSAALKGSSRTSGGTIKTATAACGGQRNTGLHRGLVTRLASRAAEEAEVVRCVQETPRFCHPLVEDKEYFSGSIVEGSRAPPEPSLKKSSSYNEER